VLLELVYMDVTSLRKGSYADALAKKGAKITQTHIRETSYHTIKLHLKQVFQSVYRDKVIPKNHGSKN